MAEDMAFLNDYLIVEYGVHKEGDIPISGDLDQIIGLDDDEYHSENEEMLELFF